MDVAQSVDVVLLRDYDGKNYYTYLAMVTEWPRRIFWNHCVKELRREFSARYGIPPLSVCVLTSSCVIAGPI